MEVGEDDVRDAEAVLRRTLEIPVDVPLRLHDRRGARLLVAHEIRGVGQAIEIELLENHPRLAPAVRYPLGCGTIRIYGFGVFHPCG